jgi:tetratricopeptide (TPR) repeat protein
MLKKAVLITVILFVFYSCKTTEFGYKVIDVNGMIYDFANKPVSNYKINIGEKKSSLTDVNGRFVIEKLPIGSYAITGEKEGYENYIGDIDITSREQIVYIRIPSAGQLLELADTALEKNQLDEAEEYIKRAYDIGDITTELLFYYATVKFRKQSYDEAIEYLQAALQRGSKDHYVEKFLEYLLSL